MRQYEYLTVELEWRTFRLEGRGDCCPTCGHYGTTHVVHQFVAPQAVYYKEHPLLPAEAPYQEILKGLSLNGWRLKESWPLAGDGRTLIFEREVPAEESKS